MIDLHRKYYAHENDDEYNALSEIQEWANSFLFSSPWTVRQTIFAQRKVYANSQVSIKLKFLSNPRVSS